VVNVFIYAKAVGEARHIVQIPADPLVICDAKKKGRKNIATQARVKKLAVKPNENGAYSNQEKSPATQLPTLLPV
jgi:hypothetical protein